MLEQIAADQKFASEVLKVTSTPTFFINGEMIKGETSFEEFDKRIKSLLKSRPFAPLGGADSLRCVNEAGAAPPRRFFAKRDMGIG